MCNLTSGRQRPEGPPPRGRAPWYAGAPGGGPGGGETALPTGAGSGGRGGRRRWRSCGEEGTGAVDEFATVIGVGISLCGLVASGALFYLRN